MLEFPEEHPNKVLAAMQMEALTRQEIAVRLGITPKDHRNRYAVMQRTLALMVDAGWIACEAGAPAPRYLARTMMALQVPLPLVALLERIADALAPKHTF